MTVRHRRAVTARLIIVTVLLVAGIWYLYQRYIAVAPAPPPRVIHSGFLLCPTSHT
jgi:hypothetical protein